MNDDEKYINEMRMMTEQRKAERAKYGTDKIRATYFCVL